MEALNEATLIKEEVIESRTLKDAHRICWNLINSVPSYEKKKKSTGLLIINVFKIIFPKISHDWKEIYLEQNLYKIFKLKHL